MNWMQRAIAAPAAFMKAFRLVVQPEIVSAADARRARRQRARYSVPLFQLMKIVEVEYEDGRCEYEIRIDRSEGGAVSRFKADQFAVVQSLVATIDDFAGQEVLNRLSLPPDAPWIDRVKWALGARVDLLHRVAETTQMAKFLLAGKASLIIYRLSFKDSGKALLFEFREPYTCDVDLVFR